MKIFIFSNLTKNHPKGSGPSGTRPQVVITTFECMRIQQIFPSTNFLQRRIQRLFEHRSRPSGPQVFPVRRCFWYAGTSIELQVPFAAVRSQFAAVGSQFAARRWRSFPPIHEIRYAKCCHGSTSNSGPMQQVSCWKWTFLVQADKISWHPQSESIWQSGIRLPRSPILALASFPSDTLISQDKTFVG